MTQTVSIRLEDDVIARIDALTRATERSRAWLMAQAVTQYVEHESWQIEAIQSTLESMRRGDACFASGEAVDAWLASWGAAEEGAAPPVRK
ncbi:MAG: ribbon-helix-helix protein, CopG family [Betaproteobacteria bacterium]|nr:ribbon-helix-helix protein, CopG family [Betaproteobacteria bacterium]